MKIAGATLNQIPMDWQGNVKNIVDALKEAKDQNVALVCFPELCITGYCCEDLFLSDWLWQKSLEVLMKEVVPETEHIAAAVGLPLSFEGKMYNCVAFLRNGKLEYIIPKQNLALDGVHYEPRWFTPWPVAKKSTLNYEGNSYPMGDYTIDFQPYCIGFEICEDAWRVDRPAPRLIDRGVNLILNPSASHFALEKSTIREALVINSSSQYHCTYLYANLLGNEAGRMIYDGEVMIARNGKLKLKNPLLSFRDYELCIWDDVEEESRDLPIYKADRNKEFHRSVSLALFDYMRKSRSNGFVLSLSGGADSSTCAVLVSEMVRLGVDELGLEGFLAKIRKQEWLPELNEANLEREITQRLLTTAYQSTKNSGKDTFESAEMLAAEIGAVFYHWSIDEEVHSYSKKIEKNIGRSLTWQKDDITLQNIQARARSPIIWMLANLNNALLLTTSNRSEGDVGYTTMDGDTSGSIAPIAGIDKPFIVQWLKWAERELGYSSLRKVNSLIPTAELRPSEITQTDEKDLMPYPLLLAIEKLAIRDRLSPVQVFLELKRDPEFNRLQCKPAVMKFFRLWTRNQWKRERIAPSFHLDDLNVDPKTWCRFPILSSGFATELKALENLD